MKIIIDTGQDGKVINARVRQKTATLSQWLDKDPVILDGEQAFIIRDDGTPLNFRIGDGSKKFSELPDWVAYEQGTYAPVSGSALPTLGAEIRYTWVGPGTYTQSGGPDIVVPSGYMGVLSWDGSVWSLSQSAEMPVQVADGEIEEGDDRAISGNTVYKKDYWNLSKSKIKPLNNNLFNKNYVIKGIYLNKDDEVESENRIVSNFIDISNNNSEYLTISGLTSDIRWAFHYQFLDEDFEVVEYGFIPRNDSGHISSYTIHYTDSSIRYFRMTVFSDRPGETNDLNTIQIEFGDTPTSYQNFEGLIVEAYGYELGAEYAEKKLGTPLDGDDISNKRYVDSTIDKAYSKVIYRDSDNLFNMESEGFDRIYSQSTPSNSLIGYIREVDRSGFINRISLLIGRNQYTDSTINVSVGFVNSVGSFDVGDENIVYSTSFNSNDLPSDGVVYKTIVLDSDIKVDSGDVLVILFDTPTAIPVYETDVSGNSILYQTEANPSRWSYGYRVSSGVELSYSNEDFDSYIKNLLGAQDPFKDMNIVTIGDSITYHSGSWARILFEKYGDKYINLAISGCRFQDRENTEINLDDNISHDSKDNTALNQLLRLAKKLTPQGQQISITNPYRNETFTVPSDKGLGTEEFNDPDLVVVAMGTNDSEYGSEGDIFNILNTPLNDLDRKAGMVEALRFFTEYLISLCPNALIVFVTPIQASWGSSRRYEVTVNKRNRIIENCNYYAVPVIDAFINSGISEKFEIQSSQGKYLSDGLHPDDKGKRLMARYIGNELVKLISKIEL